jgi:membrane protease YdiL (CAAX protease family)
MNDKSRKALLMDIAPHFQPQSRNRLRVGCAIAYGGALYILWWTCCRVISGAINASVAMHQVLFKVGLVVIALIAWRLGGQPLVRMGVRLPLPRSSRVRWYALSTAAMATAAACAQLLGVSHPVISKLTPLEVVVVAWGIGGIGEEVFVRGLVQSLMYAESDRPDSTRLADIAASSLFFAAIHLPLLWTSMGIGGIAIVLVMASLVGAVAAIARRETASLIDPIGIHVVSNVGAAVVASAMNAAH